MRTVTEKECIASQRRNKNAYGDTWPYKGYNYEKSDEPMELPDGWVFVHIPTWGCHIRREDDTNYMKDL